MIKYVEAKDVIIEHVGEIEEWVYDIEVCNAHNFFANDILVHNSCYFALSSILKKLIGKDKLEYSNELIDAIDDFCEGFIAPKIAKENENIANELNAPFNCLAMKREKICESAFWQAKKRYAVKVWDDEGLRLKEPKIAITGLEIKRSSTPKFAQKKLMSLVELLLSEKANEAPNVLKGYRKDFMRADLIDIGLPMGINSMPTQGDYVAALNMGRKMVIPQHIKGALIFNELIRLCELEGIYRPCANGTKVYRYLLKPNPITNLFSKNVDTLDIRLSDAKIDVICIPQELESNKILDFFADFIDRDKMFGVAMGDAGERMIEACNISSTSANTLDAFFC